MDYGLFLMPRLNINSKSFLLVRPGVPFYVNRKSPVKEDVIDFLKWFSRDENALEYAIDSTGISPVTASQNAMNPKLKSLFESAEIKMDPTKLFESEDRYIMEMMLLGVKKILANQMTPDQLTKALEDAQIAKQD